MKKLIAAMCLLMLLAQCKKTDNPVPHGTSIALFAVRQDNTGYHLLGGKVLPLPAGNTAGNTIPLTEQYEIGVDVSSMILTYTPTGDTIFNGGTNWVGTGIISYPVLDPPGAFFKAVSPAPVPNTGSVQLISQSAYPADINSVWAQLSDLYVVSEYIKRHAKVAVMQYAYLAPAQIPAGTNIAQQSSWIWMFYINNPS